jgi:outer membrane protein assembly factor BamB
MGWRLHRNLETILSTGFLSGFLIILVFVSCSCSGQPGRVVNKVLTAEEMAIPPGRYQNGIDMRHTCQVDLDSPQTEPVLRWVVKPIRTADTTDVLVDGQGGIWYNDNLSSSSPSKIIVRLNPDGTEDFRQTLFPGRFIVHPVIALASAIVLRVLKQTASANRANNNSEIAFESKYFLECIDVEGLLRWRTDPIEIPLRVEDMAWRAPGDMLMMPASETSVNFYSVENGEFLESLQVPGFPITPINGGPIPLDDGSWIFHGRKLPDTDDEVPFVTRINQDGTSIWYNEYPEFNFSLPVIINDRGILCCSGINGVTTINSEDGSFLWQKFNRTVYPRGVTYDGNFILSGADSLNDDYYLRLITDNGIVLWNDDVHVRDFDAVLVYRDNSIMVAYQFGISLINPDGSVRWTVDLNDLQYMGNEYFFHWRLNPTPDGNLVAIADNMYGGYHSEIFYLEQQ